VTAIEQNGAGPVGCDALNAAALADMLSGDVDLVELARTFVEADAARWASMMQPPYNDGGDRHRRTCHTAHAAWTAWTAALTERGLQVGDRRALAVELAKR